MLHGSAVWWMGGPPRTWDKGNLGQALLVPFLRPTHSPDWFSFLPKNTLSPGVETWAPLLLGALGADGARHRAGEPCMAPETQEGAAGCLPSLRLRVNRPLRGW